MRQIRNVSCCLWLCFTGLPVCALSNEPIEIGIAFYFASHSDGQNGPARSPFVSTASNDIAERLLESQSFRGTLGLEKSDIENFRLEFRRIGALLNTNSSSRMLESIDLRDDPYYDLLMTYCKSSVGVAREFIAIEGFSALRRPVFEELIGLSTGDRAQLTEMLNPIWEQSSSLHRAKYEQVKTQEADLGLRILALQADLSVLRSLSAEETKRLSELVTTAMHGEENESKNRTE